MSDIEQRLREQGSIEERLRLPISESMFVRRSDMLRALFAERAEAADTIASLRSKLEEAEGVFKDGPEENEIDRLRMVAFQTNSNDDKAAYYLAVSKWFQDRHYRTLASLREADHA